MKLTTKSRYGTRAILDLAGGFDGETPVQLKQIAKRQKISVKYLEQIMTSLSRSGIVKGVKGKGGGFIPAKPLDKITLNSIIEALEGKPVQIQCAGSDNFCKHCKTCIMNDVWKKMKEAMENVLDSYTLKDMVELNKIQLRRVQRS
jgi:Rrf2 family transcriptional regulator, cysteine metabolism repressor